MEGAAPVPPRPAALLAAGRAVPAGPATKRITARQASATAVSSAIPKDAPSLPESTNEAPLLVAPRTARSVTADSQMSGLRRDRTDLTTRLIVPARISRPSPAWMASAAGPPESAADRGQDPPAGITCGHGDVEVHRHAQRELDQQGHRHAQARPPHDLRMIGPLGSAVYLRGTCVDHRRHLRCWGYVPSSDSFYS